MEDHRIERRKEHLLTDIIVIAMSAVICAAENSLVYPHIDIKFFGKYINKF